MAKSGNKRGRPKVLGYKSTGEMQKDVDKYFDETPEEDWTITGLAMAISTDRQTLYGWKKGCEYARVVALARQRIEMHYEKLCKTRGNASGIMFILKNMRWADRTEIEQNIRTKDETGINKNLRKDERIKLIKDRLKETEGQENTQLKLRKVD
jgi:hypothetical protein